MFRRAIFYLALSSGLLGVACAKEVFDPIGPHVDFADPKSVVGAVFYAARAGDAAPLSGLCRAGLSEPSVERICRLAEGDVDWPSFVAAFRKARLNGEPRIHDDHAALNFVFGERATDNETMELAQRDGRWYLLRF